MIKDVVGVKTAAVTTNGNGHVKPRGFEEILSLGRLSFEGFSFVNMERHLKWPRKGDALHDPKEEWDLSAWGCAVAEEAGEVCGAIKRVNRIAAGHVLKKAGEPITREDAILMLKKEIGDTVTYLDLLAQHFGSSLEECTRLAFNGVSEREGMEYYI